MYGDRCVLPKAQKVNVLFRCDPQEYSPLRLASMGENTMDMLFYVVTGCPPCLRLADLKVANKKQLRDLFHKEFLRLKGVEPTRLRMLSGDYSNLEEVCMNLGYPKKFLPSMMGNSDISKHPGITIPQMITGRLSDMHPKGMATAGMLRSASSSSAAEAGRMDDNEKLERLRGAGFVTGKSFAKPEVKSDDDDDDEDEHMKNEIRRELEEEVRKEVEAELAERRSQERKDAMAAMKAEMKKKMKAEMRAQLMKTMKSKPEPEEASGHGGADESEAVALQVAAQRRMAEAEAIAMAMQALPVGVVGPSHHLAGGARVPPAEAPSDGDGNGEEDCDEEGHSPEGEPTEKTS